MTKLLYLGAIVGLLWAGVALCSTKVLLALLTGYALGWIGKEIST